VENVVVARATSKISVVAARVAIAASVAVIALLTSLHMLSPEFDPAWRLVSEYATGRYGWVLSLMFVCWAFSSWALTLTIWSQVRTTAGKVGVAALVAAGVGEAMAAVFDINQPLHDVAGMLGVLGLPAAAMLISVSLTRTQGWSSARTALLWTANLNWIMLVLFVVAMIVMIVGYTQAGNRLTPEVIAVVGYPNRLGVVLSCVWVITVAWRALQLPVTARQ
jgi:Protein of unknown function (DUF998)